MNQTVKPELKNPEMKEAYVAAHWGQNVIKDINGSGVLCTYPVVASNMYRIEESHLELTPLEHVTDEDAIAIDFVSASHFNKVMESYGDEFIDLLLKHHQVDYLRLRGYAIDWNGYKVKELIEAGYCQLKGEGDE